MTNEEWLEHLAHNDIPGLRAWFKAEHVESPESGALVQCAQIDGEGRERAAESDTAPENADSRELLDADVRKWCGEYAYQADMVWTWLNRQAAITEREVEHDLMKAGRMAVEVERERIKKLTAERDNLAADLLRANNERERYREKFGKCIDYADAIHALMDDEGLA